MNPVPTILHPTDFSANSDAALPLACGLARAQGARLVIAHVEPVSGSGLDTAPADPRVCLEALEQRRERAQGPGPDHPVDVLLLHGDPVDAICRAAREARGDLIVMGSQGHSGLLHRLLGSVTEGVMRRAHCPVLTVKDPRVAATTPDHREGMAHGLPPLSETQAPAPSDDQGRVVQQACVCACRGLPIIHVHHRDFPEIWAEGDSLADGIAHLVGKLIRARESCGSHWHRDLLAQAITDVRTYHHPAPGGSPPSAREDAPSRPEEAPVPAAAPA